MVDPVLQQRQAFGRDDAVAQLWAKKPSLWSDDPDDAKIIANALGWLEVPQAMRDQIDQVVAFADEVCDAGFQHVVLMGMGGSSLCSEVLRTAFGDQPGRPRLVVLDSTVPATVERIGSTIDPARSLFLVASKSGTTTEPLAFQHYFEGRVRQLRGDGFGDQFVAITDPGTALEADATSKGYWRIFRNPSDIGGRYSALSLFGLVPAALMGVDVVTFLDRAIAMSARCRPDSAPEDNPGLELAALIGGHARQGRDKLTLVTSTSLSALGLWIEQLIAESTGKRGRGVLPVAGESLGEPAQYGDDRVFVAVRTASEPSTDLGPLRSALHPVAELVLADPLDLGAEFFRWEIATALIGQALGINPFDQPNVQESKDNTKAILQEFRNAGRMADPEPLVTWDGIGLTAEPPLQEPIRRAVGGGSGRDAFVAALKVLADVVKPDDYVAITQFFDETSTREQALQEARLAFRDIRGVATTTGYGPRFLHSTGQLHKGGPDTGVFLQLVAEDGPDLEIPEFGYGFRTLARAQALGDFRSLVSRGRRAVRIDLGSDVDGHLTQLVPAIREALGLS